MPYLIFIVKFSGALETMKKETLYLFNEYQIEIDCETFWAMCKNDFFKLIVDDK